MLSRRQPRHPHRAAPEHKPSLLQDYVLGRSMEIDVLVRAPPLARAAGLSTPMLDLLAALAIQKARDKGLYLVLPRYRHLPAR